MEKEMLRLLFQKNNPWWTEEFIVEYKPRNIYSEIQKHMHLRFVLALSGLRRVGKTTLMRKIIYDSLSAYTRQNIFYFSFDDIKDTPLMKVLDEYADYLHKDLRKEK